MICRIFVLLEHKQSDFFMIKFQSLVSTIVKTTKKSPFYHKASNMWIFLGFHWSLEVAETQKIFVMYNNLILSHGAFVNSESLLILSKMSCSYPWIKLRIVFLHLFKIFWSWLDCLNNFRLENDHSKHHLPQNDLTIVFDSFIPVPEASDFSLRVENRDMFTCFRFGEFGLERYDAFVRITLVSKNSLANLNPRLTMTKRCWPRNYWSWSSLNSELMWVLTFWFYA